jgi:hypothetical protein
MGAEPVVVGWKALTEGYFGSADRLQRALLDWDDPERTFIPLFETLNWLVAIADRLNKEEHTFNPQSEALLRGIRHARGRVHHQWAEAFELRDDVRFNPVWLGLATTPSGPTHLMYDPPETFTDWCWRAATELPPGDHERDDRWKEVYTEYLAGQPVRRALGDIRDSLITPLWIGAGGTQWPRAGS